MIEYHLSQNEDELKSAVELIQRVYVREGYYDADATGSGFITYLQQAEASTILVLEDGIMRGTVSLLEDGPKGLPMEEIFKEEIDAMRTPGRKLAEVCQLAIDWEENDGGVKAPQVSFGLLSYVVRLAQQKEVTHLCFAVGRKHVAFYEALGGIRMGSEKAYPNVQHIPATAFYLDLPALSRDPNAPSLIKKILQDQKLQIP